MGSWARFSRLPRFEKVCFLQAFFLLPLMVLALRMFSFQRCHVLLARVAGSRPAPGDAQGVLATAHSVARMVRAASRRVVPSPTCLHNSLVLWFLLRRRGIASELHIGGRRQEGRFEAHAWVECAGEVLNDSDDVHQRYAPFDRPIVSGEARTR